MEHSPRIGRPTSCSTSCPAANSRASILSALTRSIVSKILK
jgi:hypothetical protein